MHLGDLIVPSLVKSNGQWSKIEVTRDYMHAAENKMFQSWLHNALSNLIKVGLSCSMLHVYLRPIIFISLSSFSLRTLGNAQSGAY